MPSFQPTDPHEAVVAARSLEMHVKGQRVSATPNFPKRGNITSMNCIGTCSHAKSWKSYATKGEERKQSASLWISAGSPAGAFLELPGVISAASIYSSHRERSPSLQLQRYVAQRPVAFDQQDHWISGFQGHQGRAQILQRADLGCVQRVNHVAGL